MKESSGRGGRDRDVDERESLALFLLSWVTGDSPRGDNGDEISIVGRLTSFGGEVSIAGLNRAGAGISILSGYG